MAKLTKAQLKELLDSTIYPNDDEEIKALNHNNMLTDFLDSGMNESQALLQNNLNANNNKIINLTDPTNDQDVATKKYVDDNEVGGKPVANRYNDITALIADQGNQEEGYLYYVINATGDNRVLTGDAYYEYFGTTLGAIVDYILLGGSPKLDKEASSDQRVKSNVTFAKNASVEGLLIPFTNAPIFAVNKSNIQEMPVTAALSSINLSGAAAGGNYRILLKNGATGPYTYPSLGTSFGTATTNSETLDGSSKVMNMIDVQVTVSTPIVVTHSIETVTLP